MHNKTPILNEFISNKYKSFSNSLELMVELENKGIEPSLAQKNNYKEESEIFRNT